MYCVSVFHCSTERYKSENFSNDSVDKLGLSSAGGRRDRSDFVSVGSAEALKQVHTPWGSYRDIINFPSKSIQKKRLSFSNPFDPNKMHSEAPAFERRWVHVFPTNKRGVAFQIHHKPMEQTSLDTESPQLSIKSTLPQRKRKGILKHSIIDNSGQLTSSSVGGGSQSGSFRNSSFGNLISSKQSPAPHNGEQGIVCTTNKKQKGSPSMNRSSITGQDKPVSESSSSTHTPASSRSVSAENTPETLRRQTRDRWNDPFLSSNSENFSSVRRTGVDWTSLIEPAHLPVTTDFYPAKDILDRDYAQYNSNLLVFREEQDHIITTTDTSATEKRLAILSIYAIVIQYSIEYTYMPYSIIIRNTVQY